MPTWTPLLAGFGFGLSLIVAIGAQNAFVLRQGIARRHVAAVVAVCALSDAALISAGVFGAGAVVDHAPWAVKIAYWGGAAFLLCYAVLSARRAWRPSVQTVADDATPSRVGPIVATAFALTWLNPHVYLDTVVLLGSVASTFGAMRVWFGVGAAIASAVWFTALGYGARALRPMFAKPAAWRVLDGLIAGFMLFLGVGLITQSVSS